VTVQRVDESTWGLCPLECRPASSLHKCPLTLGSNILFNGYSSAFYVRDVYVTRQNDGDTVLGEKAMETIQRRRIDTKKVASFRVRRKGMVEKKHPDFLGLGVVRGQGRSTVHEIS
jgi:hypothetical protein